MQKYTGMAGYAHGGPRKLGVLIANLGSPTAPTARAVRRFLAEFLADPRVVELPRWLWLPVLHGVVLVTRPRRSAAAYAKVWTPEGSPLIVNSKQQCAGLQARLAAALPGRIEVALGMRYGAPSLAGALRELRSANARRILVLPLYPQYSAAASGSVFDAVSRELQTWRWVPALRTIDDYHADPGYIAALAASLRAFWAQHGRGERLLMSFHGIPEASFLAGDPYHCQCHATGRLLAEALGLAAAEWRVTFQSRFGRQEWLRPATDETLIELAGSGIRRVDVVCPGFAADCLETLEEISIRYGEAFLAAGGAELHYVPALNARDEHLAALAALVLRHLEGWPEAAPEWEAARAAAAAAAACQRARAMGAPA